MSDHHLAQFNVSRLLAPLDSPQLADFMAALEPLNQLADQAPGFVWRFQTGEGDATSVRPFDDDQVIVNLSVWESIEHLAEFAYGGEHLDIMRRRRKWFEKMAEAYLVLWWVPAGEVPTVADSVARLQTLRQRGPSPEAFTFRRPFPAPDRPAAIDPVPDSWLCPA
jgi:hypothetical protein